MGIELIAQSTTRPNRSRHRLIPSSQWGAEPTSVMRILETPHPRRGGQAIFHLANNVEELTVPLSPASLEGGWLGTPPLFVDKKSYLSRITEIQLHKNRSPCVVAPLSSKEANITKLALQYMARWGWGWGYRTGKTVQPFCYVRSLRSKQLYEQIAVINIINFSTLSLTHQLLSPSFTSKLEFSCWNSKAPLLPCYFTSECILTLTISSKRQSVTFP